MLKSNPGIEIGVACRSSIVFRFFSDSDITKVRITMSYLSILQATVATITLVILSVRVGQSLGNVRKTLGGWRSYAHGTATHVPGISHIRVSCHSPEALCDLP